jgi:hypothetical protein
VQHLPSNYLELRENMLGRQAVLIKEFNIPACLVLGADETFMHYTPASYMTYAPCGDKHVAIAGEEKAGCTVMVTHTMDGRLLPLQVWAPCIADSLHRPCLQCAMRMLTLWGALHIRREGLLPFGAVARCQRR